MKALITGSLGFIGSHMWEELDARGYDVYGCDIRRGVDTMTLFARATDRYDLVVHAAARSPHRAAIDGDPASHVYNRLLDAALFDWAIRTGQGRVLYISSCAVLDETPDAYGLYKLAGETMAQHARDAGLPVTVVRPYSGYGEDQSEDFPFGAFVARAKRREDPFELWNAGAVRDWIHVDDLVSAALAVIEDGTTEPVGLCTGVGTSCAAVAELACHEVGYSPTFHVRRNKPQGASRRVGDPTAMLKLYQPKIDLAEGVRRACASA